MASTQTLPKHHEATGNEKMVIGASSLGTVFEWYDFYLYGSLAAYIAQHFFSGVNSSLGFILALAAFAAGFAVRPFGAIVFGRIGDIVGRKNTFLVTMVLMGLSTFIVGLLPSYEQIGVAAPIILVSLRLIQGLALGGEYGGAATYVAEHAPNNKRGLYTAWIQTTATLGLFASLLVIMATRLNMSPEAFAEWGWRVPFLISSVLLAVSIWIRLQLNESPVFQKMKEEGKTSKAPLAEAFGNWKNLKVVFIALFCAVAGQAVVWYTGQFYALFFLKQSLRVEAVQADTMVAIALAIGTPFFIFFGWLSDKIGRKPIIMAGCALAALTYFPLFNLLTQAANPALATAMRESPVTIHADPADCHFQFAPGELKEHITYRSSCDLARSALAGRSVSYTAVDLPAGSTAAIHVGDTVIASFDGEAVEGAAFTEQSSAFGGAVAEAINAAGYPTAADNATMNRPLIVGILALLVIYVTMVYGPIAAMLVELFPSRIRYTSMSLPYHIGNGWFGGFLPTTAFAIVAATGNIYNGLWYPVIIAGATLVLGLLFLPETKNRTIED
jgi:MFS family permease